MKQVYFFTCLPNGEHIKIASSEDILYFFLCLLDGAHTILLMAVLFLHIK